jgi:hypothetical protein
MVQNWCSIIVRIRKSYKAHPLRRRRREMITSTMSTFDQLSDSERAISARKSLYEIDNLIRSSMEEYGGS